ncbi:MAG: 4Fe-4S dicluster domain-containing protein [Candidatus Dadabacteria bacterium]|nr:4Fe-4S dicluster domain-containing protein [Candidatus Dadabacteria bacterium]
MAYIIAEPCIDVKDKSCVDACPVDCIYEAEDQLVIHPEECIDCGACVDPCPVDAIYHEDELPDKWQHFIDINKDFFEGKTDLEPARKD